MFKNFSQGTILDQTDQTAHFSLKNLKFRKKRVGTTHLESDDSPQLQICKPYIF